METVNYVIDKLEEYSGGRLYLIYISSLIFFFGGQFIYFMIKEHYRMKEININQIKKQNKLLKEKYTEIKNINDEITTANIKLKNMYNKLFNKVNYLEKDKLYYYNNYINIYENYNKLYFKHYGKYKKEK